MWQRLTKFLGGVPTPTAGGKVLTTTGSDPDSFGWTDSPIGVPIPPAAGKQLSSTGAGETDFEWTDPATPAIVVLRATLPNDLSDTVTNWGATYEIGETEVYDSASTYNVGQRKFYAPVAGYYMVSASVATYVTADALSAGDGTGIELLHNGVQAAFVATSSQIVNAFGYRKDYVPQINDIIYLAATDTLQIRAVFNYTQGADTVVMEKSGTWFCIHLLAAV